MILSATKQPDLKNKIIINQKNPIWLPTTKKLQRCITQVKLNIFHNQRIIQTSIKIIIILANYISTKLVKTI